MANFPEKLNEPALKVGGITGTGTGRVDLKADQATRSAMERYAPLADFAKTLQQVGPAVAQIQDLEHKQSKARKMYESEIESIKGLEKDGLISEHALEQFLTEEQGRLQRTGYIRAYENLMIQEEVDKQRANIRLAAYGTEMEKLIPLMTNPDPQFRLSYDEAAQRVYGIFAEATANGRAVGTDSFGNPVMFNPDELSSGELIALTRGLTEMRNQYSIAIEENTHMRTVEGMAQNLDVNVAGILSASIGGAISTEEAMDMVTEEFNKAYNFGVPKINERFVTSLKSLGETMSSSADPDPASFEGFMSLLDDVQSGLVLRRNEKGEEVLFGPLGTENHYRIEQVRDQFVTDWNQARTAASNAESDRLAEAENLLKSYALKRLISITQGGRTVTPEDERSLTKELLERASRFGITDTDKVLAAFNNTMDALSSNPDDDVKTGRMLNDISIFKYDVVKLNEFRYRALSMFEDGEISFANYKSILTDVDSALSDIESSESSRIGANVTGDGVLGFTNLLTDINGAMADTLKANDQRKEVIGPAGLPVGFETIGGHDNAPIPVFSSPVEEWAIEARDVALNGGRLPEISVEGFSEDVAEGRNRSDLQTLVEMGYSLTYINNLVKSLNTQPEPFDGPVGSDAAARSRGIKIKKRYSEYAQYKALEQALYFADQRERRFGAEAWVRQVEKSRQENTNG